jgi:hypothetical protein
MSAPQWIKVDGPPPGPPPRAPKAPRQIKPRTAAPAPASWAPPTTAPVSLAPPVIKIPYAGIAVIRSEYTCLPREGSDTLTACGRLLFLDAITISDDPVQVTCCFCQMRLRNEAA